MKRVTKSLVYAGLAAIFVTPFAAQAADRGFCRDYTQAALRQVHAVMELPRCAARVDGGPRWSSEAFVHYRWCRDQSMDAANDEREARKDFIDRCR